MILKTHKIWFIAVFLFDSKIKTKFVKNLYTQHNLHYGSVQLKKILVSTCFLFFLSQQISKLSFNL